MADERIKHVTVIGVGLLGGSAALAIKADDPRVKVAGVGRRQSSLDQALAAGAIDTAHLDAAEALVQTDLVILATPVGAFADHMRAVASDDDGNIDGQVHDHSFLAANTALPLANLEESHLRHSIEFLQNYQVTVDLFAAMNLATGEILHDVRDRHTG